MKNIIFLLFANSANEPLKHLQEEESNIHRTLSLREKEGHFSIFRESRATRESILEYLTLHKEEILIFHYSGHAGGSELFAEDHPVYSDGIADLLAQSPKLKLVLLNGCSTKGQVDKLMSLAGDFAVISTHSPVGDDMAFTYAKIFYQELCNNHKTIAEAHNSGLAAAQALSDVPVMTSRDIFRDEEISLDEPAWDLSSLSELHLTWRLPQQVITEDFSSFEPNSELTEKLIEAFAEYNEQVQEVFQKENLSDSRKRKAILEALPLPISEQLRKLFAIRDARASAHIFFDTLGPNRLKQLITAYKTMIELIAFIHLAQLWNLSYQEQELKVSVSQRNKLRKFFDLSLTDRKSYYLMDLVKLIIEIFQANKIPDFLQEFEALYPSLEEESPLSHALRSLHDIEQELHKLGGASMPVEQAVGLCVSAENHLAYVYSQLAFIIRYKMKSVKNIGLQNYPLEEPKYIHTIIKLIQNFFELDEEKEERHEAMFTTSVFLENSDKEYLNLTPFVIDQNAFDPKAALAKILYFNVHEASTHNFAFKHVYNPQDNLVIIKDKAPYYAIKQQLEAFSKRILNP